MRLSKHLLFITMMILCLSIHYGCAHNALKPLPPVDHSDPNVWSVDKCKDVPHVWWGVQGQDQETLLKVWHCYNWKVYDKTLAP